MLALVRGLVGLGARYLFDELSPVGLPKQSASVPFGCVSPSLAPRQPITAERVVVGC
jgi:hypothetical protein